MSTKQVFLVGVFALFTLPLFAQSTFVWGSLPALNVNKKLDQDWSINAKWESRQQFRAGEFGGEQDRRLRHVLNDLSAIGAKKVGLNAKLGVGYLIRLRSDGEVNHRVIQQFTQVRTYPAFRLAHRFASDQTFVPDEPMELRLRYRLASEIPLNGASLDAKEFYLKFNNEYLNRFQGGTYDLEVRLIGLLGYELNPKNKLEFGLDYRINSFLGGDASHRFWMSLNWFVVL